MSTPIAQHKPSVQHVAVDRARDGQRLDNFLLAWLENSVPRSVIYRIIRTGQVRVNGKRAKPMQKLKHGDEIRIPPVRQTPNQSTDIPEKLLKLIRENILYQDDFQMIIDKPSGLAVHAGSGVNYGLIDVLKQLFPERPDIALVHRLDRATSGCVLVGYDRQSQVTQQQAMREGRIKKHYLALLCGRPGEAHFEVSLPLMKSNTSKRSKMLVSEDGKHALTRFKVLEHYKKYTLVDAEPVTGRTHQIRVHAAEMGLPLAGDTLYGQRDLNPPGLKTLFLHAQTLQLDWPDDILVNSEMPAELRNCLQHLPRR